MAPGGADLSASTEALPVSFGMFFYRRPRSWLRESIHAPIGPPFFPSLENFRAVSLLTMLRE